MQQRRVLNRRKFLVQSGIVAGGLLASGKVRSSAAESNAAASHQFVSRWDHIHDRTWLGPDYWANPLQDWRIAGGRLECLKAAPDRNVHLLTRQLNERPGNFELSIRLGRTGGESFGAGTGSAGFRVGIRGPLPDYRNALIFGRGLDAGITAEGSLFFGDVKDARRPLVKWSLKSIDLRLSVEPKGSEYSATLSVLDPATGKVLDQLTRDRLPADDLVGNIALVANFGAGPTPRRAGQRANAAAAATGAGLFWFEDWRVSGTKVAVHEDRAFGPILFNQYTLSGGVMKMTAQMPPIGEHDSQTVRLQLKRGRRWQSIGEEKIHPEARTATFRIEKWDAKKNAPYRLAYTLRPRGGEVCDYFWEGTIRRDPVDSPVLTVADVSCNVHSAFPNTDYVAKMAKLNPDLLAFTGDQFYESSAGYGVQRTPVDAAILDLLRKWYVHGWTWRELTRDRPSISIPDDHDVYQGNIWGESGEPRRGTQEMGGYDMAPAWVNVVHRTQTSHHPDPPDPAPIKQGISAYFGAMTYGRISFAIIADRQFKSGPEGKVPPTGGRGDHVLGPDFDPKTADQPGLELLGQRQMAFLRAWVSDWRGADMKAVVSQTIFTGMATTHGGRRERLRADYDTNGWPQSARNAALHVIRKAFAFHIAGDQHLPAVIHYGIDAHNDAGAAFAGPAVNNAYPRWFEPLKPGGNRKQSAPENTGEFRDSFDHPLTVLAVANPLLEFRRSVLEAEQDKAAGMGLVRFNKAERKITIECWPFLADPTKPGTQFPGWPVIVEQLDNYGRAAAAQLPKLVVRTIKNPVLHLIDDATSEIVYSLRLSNKTWQPHVFAAGKYTARISEPETGKVKELRGLQAVANNRAVIEV